MGLPSTSCNPYQTLLAAGALRQQAAQLAHRAQMFDDAARMQLELDATAAHTKTIMPGTTLCIAYGGPADGVTTRVPTDQLAAVKIMPLIKVDPESGVNLLSYDYQPSQIIRLGPHIVGALVVPKGKIAATHDQLREGADDGPIPQALAKLLQETVGFNSELIYGIVSTFLRTARDNVEAASETPMFMHIEA